MEVLQLVINDQSHLSSGLTIDFSPRGGSGSRPGDAPTLTMELGSPVSNVSLHDP